MSIKNIKWYGFVIIFAQICICGIFSAFIFQYSEAVGIMAIGWSGLFTLAIILALCKL